MYYKVWSKEGYAHLWQYDYFREEVDGILVEHNTDRGIINYIIYRVDNYIDDKIFDEYYFNYEILANYTPPKKDVL